MVRVSLIEPTTITTSKHVATTILRKSKLGGRESTIHGKFPGVRRLSGRILGIKSHSEDVPAGQEPHLAFV